ncbi:aspartate aminotransferase family protein [Kordiimonas lipolytica]|uniref:Aspartate aminotransferase family protein n=1 Tax=Kordiimonas lipolytica TaxID=1662421 RepID=A0ABV8UAT0_9PROT|nr:aspartate aminotransferase family protein [Kordiimonas lipolytica]
MSFVAHRSLKETYRKAVRGEGIYVFDADGNKYLDGSSGAGVSCLGHSNERVISAIKEQAEKLCFASSVFYTNDPTEELAAVLAKGAPGDLKYATFGCGGSEQVEGALKIARQYHVDRGEPSRTIMIARRQSYHGMTLGTLNVGGHIGRRQLYTPMFAPTHLIAPHYAYRERREGETAAAYSLRVANELETKILELGQENVAAFIAEPVVGATNGCVAADDVYFKRIREICDQYGVLLILDEVFCGMGRTGTRHACEQDSVLPDLLVMAKGLGGGYQPISALLISEKIINAVKDGRGYIANGHTYMNHPLNCAAGLAVQQEIADRDLIANVAKQGAYLRARLEESFGQHAHVGDIRGRGLMQALEFVVDRETKEPFPPEKQLWAKLQKTAMTHGLMCYPNGGTIDGIKGDHVILAPPYIISEAQVDEMVEKLEKSVAQTINQL